MAILREQGVNGQLEMAAAFDRAGFTAVDVHMSDIIAGRVALVSAVAAELSSDDRVVAGQQVAPGAIAEPRSVIG